MTPLQRAEELLSKITEYEGWIVSEDNPAFVIMFNRDCKMDVANTHGSDSWEKAKFIAAAPALMRELVEQIEELQFQVLCETKCKDNVCLAYENKIKELTQQIEELKAGNKYIALGDFYERGNPK